MNTPFEEKRGLSLANALKGVEVNIYNEMTKQAQNKSGLQKIKKVNLLNSQNSNYAINAV